VNSTLTAIPIRQRRRLAAVLGGFAVLFLAIGAVTVTDTSSAGLVVIAAIAFLVGITLALVAWGVFASVRRDGAERRLDDAVQAALAANGQPFTCDCGHDHDPDELHVVDEPAAEAAEPARACAHDGSGVECAHSCDTCVLAAQRR
jgi:hypothetical protein